MNGYNGGVHSGTSGLTHPLLILGQALDGGSCWGIMQSSFLVFFGDSGGPAAPHHFQYGGGCSGALLDFVGSTRHRRAGKVWKVGATPRQQTAKLSNGYQVPGLDHDGIG